MKRLALISALLLAGAVQAGEIVIHKQPNFTGGALTLRDDKPNLAPTGFMNQASSIEVKSGRWQLCSQPDFNGDCMTLEQGRYATLDPKINHRVESVRELPVPVVADNTYRRSYHAERYARERAREERLALEREREALRLEREERYIERYPERYADDRYTYRGSRW